MRVCRALMLATGIVAGSLTALSAQQAKNQAKDVLDLVRQSEEGQDVARKAAALKPKFSTVRVVMQLYNARSQGGVGFGAKGGRIERRLIDLDEDGISAEALKKESADLARVAHVNLVAAEITRGFAPDKPFLGRGKKEWDRDLDALKSASNDLLKAVKASDPKAVQSAAAKINHACNSCHDGER
jgi:hypothetical protein